jgi:hypothetical protein
MNRFASLILALVLAGAGSTALAEQTKDQVSTQTAKPQPVQMTDAQMDNVAGGLITVVAIDVVDVQNVANNLSVDVAIPANVGANVVLAILGAAAGGVVPTQVGRIRQ